MKNGFLFLLAWRTHKGNNMNDVETTLEVLDKELPTFAEFGLRKEIMQSIDQAGFKNPSPIQTMVIPVIMEGRDVVGQAQTGTGKTAAFGLPKPPAG